METGTVLFVLSPSHCERMNIVLGKRNTVRVRVDDRLLNDGIDIVVPARSPPSETNAA